MHHCGHLRPTDLIVVHLAHGQYGRNQATIEGAVDMGMEPQPPHHPEPGPQPLGAGVYAGIAFASLAATCLVGFGMYYMRQRSLHPSQ
jgi:hypothetical protein